MKLSIRAGKQQRCPYCHDEFAAGEATLTCASCTTQYHLDCAESCVILGCSGDLREGDVAAGPNEILVQVRPRARPRAPALLHVEATGLAGQDGRQGRDGARARSPGEPGSPGGDGGQPRAGAEGGSVHVVLDQPEPRRVRISGEWIGGDSTRRNLLEEHRLLGEEGAIQLAAQGGRGGAGGRGGEGGRGATGRSGSDATRYTSGTRGGKGGRGGRGGAGTAGADGGSGGRIVVEVAPEDTHLLLLVDAEVEGGAGGAEGQNGSGGAGGAGGFGGNTYSWNETERYTDNQGNPRTRTRSRSNPGGSRGIHGANGAHAAAWVRAGSTGPRGTLEFRVGDQVYSAPYELRLRALSHASLNADGIYEPGERVRVHGVTVQNTGPMPLPQRPVEIRVVAGEWIEPGQESLQPRPGLEAIESARLPGELQFRIGDYQATVPGAPFGRSCEFSLRAHLRAVQRDFPNFSEGFPLANTRFRISFPAEISEIVSPPSLGPDEVMRLSLDLRNVSQSALGLESEEGRVLGVRLFLPPERNEVGPGALLFDLAGRPAGPEGILHPIQDLTSGAEISLEAYLGISNDAPTRGSVAVHAALELGYPDEPLRTRDVQLLEHVARVGARYRSDSDANLLLVVNHTTSATATARLQMAARAAGYTPAVWDLSLEGRLHLDQSGVLDDFEGGAIAICDDLIDLGRERTQAGAFFSPTEVRRALAKRIGVAYLGEGRSLSKLLASPHPQPSHEVEDLLEYVAESEWALAHQKILTGWQVFGGPSDRHLEKEAARLQAELRARFPQRRFLVVRRYKPETVAQVAILTKWSMGALEVRELSPASSCALVRHFVDLPDLQSWTAEDVTLDFLLLKSPQQALTRFWAELTEQDAGFGPGDPQSLLSQVLAAGLALEQREIAHVGWRRGLSRWGVLEVAPRLRTLTESAGRWLRDVHPDSSRGRALLQLMAQARYHAEALVRWWEWLPPFLWLRRRVGIRHATRAAVANAIRVAYAERDDWRRLANTILDDEVDALHNEPPTGDLSSRAFAAKRLLGPLAGRSTSAEVLLSNAQRITSARELRPRIANEEAERLHRSALEAAAVEGRQASLHPRTTTELLADAGVDSETEPGG